MCMDAYFFAILRCIYESDPFPLRSYFSALELALWGVSTAMILLAFFAFDREQYLTLAASSSGPRP